jgi:uncharacterized membrane protein YfbV (UPF0208 family)
MVLRVSRTQLYFVRRPTFFAMRPAVFFTTFFAVFLTIFFVTFFAGFPFFRATFLAAFIAGFRAGRFFSSSFSISAITAFSMRLARVTSFAGIFFLGIFLVAIRFPPALLVWHREFRKRIDAVGIARKVWPDLSLCVRYGFWPRKSSFLRLLPEKHDGSDDADDALGSAARRRASRCSKRLRRP